MQTNSQSRFKNDENGVSIRNFNGFVSQRGAASRSVCDSVRVIFFFVFKLEGNSLSRRADFMFFFYLLVSISNYFSRFFMHSETFTIFSGGLSTERDGKSPCITVLQGRSTTVLEMEHPVVDFITICESPWSSGMFPRLHYFRFTLTMSRAKCCFVFFFLPLSPPFSHRNARTICHCCIATKRFSIN